MVRMLSNADAELVYRLCVEAGLGHEIPVD
jgi:hypothetical protein